MGVKLERSATSSELVIKKKSFKYIKQNRNLFPKHYPRKTWKIA